MPRSSSSTGAAPTAASPPCRRSRGCSPTAGCCWPAGCTTVLRPADRHVGGPRRAGARHSACWSFPASSSRSCSARRAGCWLRGSLPFTPDRRPDRPIQSLTAGDPASRARSLVPRPPSCSARSRRAVLAGPPPPAGWTDGYVAANGIACTTGGRAKPALVMARTARRRRVVLDQPGQSDRSLRRHHVRRLRPRPVRSADRRRSVDVRSGSRRPDQGAEARQADLMGHSMGSASVAWFAASF